MMRGGSEEPKNDGDREINIHMVMSCCQEDPEMVRDVDIHMIDSCQKDLGIKGVRISMMDIMSGGFRNKGG